MSSKKEKEHNAEITKEDLLAIGNKKQNLRSDNGEDEELIERDEKVDFSGKDLDVPGRRLPDSKKASKLKDEENQLYSQGGEENESLEQDTDQLPDQ